MSVHIRPISVDEIEAFLVAISIPFGFDVTPEALARFRDVFEIERMQAAVDGEQIVATFGALTTQMTVPGSILPLAATTVVTVLPTHRRRGIFRNLMTAHLAELHQRNEPLAALWASESSIYGRFGYGPACEKSVVKLEKPYAQMHEPVEVAGTMRLVERAEAQQLFPSIYEAVARHRPGMLTRSENWWKNRVFRDTESMRRGATTHRRVLHVRDGRPVGYLIYRTRADLQRGGSEVQVIELFGIDVAAEKSLWQFVFGIDLTTTIDHWNQPVDDPLRWWLEQPRRLERKIEDGIWLRVVDVAAALAGRIYSCPGSLLLNVRDEHCPWNNGVWHLEVNDDRTARCRSSNAEPQLELSPDALGMVYLGGHRFTTLAKSGLITGSSDSLRRADALFSWEPLPFCPDFF
jgi:predicted acetyltransferase